MNNNPLIFKSGDYSTLFDNQFSNGSPNGYPCSFDSDCNSPGVCQFNVCTVNYGGNDTQSLIDRCRGISVKECAKEMQKQRENEEVSIFIPNLPIDSSSTGTNRQIYNVCNLDSQCSNNEFCMSNICVNKSNFPLIARQKRLKKYTNIFNQIDNIQSKKTPLDGILNSYEIMFLREHQLGQLNDVNKKEYKQHDDYFYF